MMTQSVGVPFTAQMAGRDLAQPQRIVQRQRMRHAGLVRLGRDHPDIVGQGARDRLPQTLRPGAWMPSSLVTRTAMGSGFLGPMVARRRPYRAAARRGSSTEPSACW